MLHEDVTGSWTAMKDSSTSESCFVCSGVLQRDGDNLSDTTSLGQSELVASHMQDRDFIII